MGGSKEDRWEPAVEHWSIAVSDGKALDMVWQPDTPIPRGGPHRYCILCLCIRLCFLLIILNVKFE